MNLRLTRIIESKEETVGILTYADTKQFICFTLEDQAQTQKVFSETRIPAGIYDIRLRTTGGMHSRYKQRFPALHKGMLELQNVPNFSYIYLHIGNTDDDTAGCILVGEQVSYDEGTFRLINSTKAYINFYKDIAPLLLEGNAVEETVRLEIIDGIIGKC